MAKYDPLRDHLAKAHPRPLIMTFEEIEAVLGDALPRSAERPQFWANETAEQGRVQREAWRGAGYDAFLIPGQRSVRFQPSSRGDAPATTVEATFAAPASTPVTVRLDPLPETHWWDRKGWGTTLRVGEVLGIIGGLIALVFAVVGLYTANEQTRLAREALTEQRISAAWQILATQAGGGNGKSYALNTLANLGEPLNGLNFGCNERLDANGRCQFPSFFSNLAIDGGSDPQARDYASDPYIENADFSNAQFEESTLTNILLINVNFTDAELSHTKFDHVDIWGADFVGAKLYGVTFSNGMVRDFNFENADVYATFENLTVDNANFTNAELGNSEIIGGFGPLTTMPSTVGEPLYNISGTRFCMQRWPEERKAAAEALPADRAPLLWEMGCPALTADFFANAFFWADNPPIDLAVYGPSVTVVRYPANVRRTQDGAPYRIFDMETGSFDVKGDPVVASDVPFIDEN